MDEILLEGKKYVPAKQAAREYHYASDYIGQLIREGKVSGQKMGRSWYVAIDSLRGYLKLENTAVETLHTQIRAPAPLSPSPATKAPPVLAQSRAKPLIMVEEYPLLTYLSDDEPTLPTLLREKERGDDVQSAPAVEIPIRTIAEPLEVSVSDNTAVSASVNTPEEMRARSRTPLIPAAAGAALSFLLATSLLVAASALTSQNIVFDAREGVATVTYSSDFRIEGMAANILSAWREIF